MRRLVRAAALLALMPLLFALSACHGTREMGAFLVPDAFDETREYEISFWAKNDTNKAQTQIYEKAIADFEALYPNVRVSMRLYTDYGRIYNDVITNISTGTTPNVCVTYPDHIATYLTGRNSVVPLDEIMADPEYGLGGSALRFDSPSVAEIVPKFLAECAFDGHQYALPYMRSTEACYVNKTYVEALGYTLPETLTWDFVWEVSEAALEKDGEGLYRVNGQKVLIPFIYKSTDNMMITLLRQLNAGYSTAEGEALLFGEATKSILAEVAAHAASGAFSTFKISSYPANFLNAGQCLFAVDSTAGATWMGSDAPLVDIAEEKLVAFETAVMTVPQTDPDDPKMISQGPSICVFNKADSQEVLASWLFAQYLLTNDVQIAYSETEGYVPVTTKARESDEYQEYLSLAGSDADAHYSVKIEAARLLLDNVERTFVTPVYNGSASLRDAAGQLIESAAKSARRKQAIDDAYFEKLYADTAALYRLDQTGPGEASGEEGPLPATAKALLGAIAAAWALMGLYALRAALRKRTKRRARL